MRGRSGMLVDHDAGGVGEFEATAVSQQDDKMSVRSGDEPVADIHRHSGHRRDGCPAALNLHPSGCDRYRAGRLRKGVGACCNHNGEKRQRDAEHDTGALPPNSSHLSNAPPNPLVATFYAENATLVKRPFAGSPFGL